ncbi:MAG: sugar transferase, partial [Pseudomonadota bacterium]
MSIIPESRQAAAPTGGLTRLRRGLAGLLSSIPFQAVCAALIGGVAPALLRENYERVADKLVSYDNSIIGTLLAALIGFMLYRKISVLPGTRTLMRVLPSFLISYALILAIFMMWRFDYSRYQFAASFAMVTTWFALIAIITPRLERWTIALVRSSQASRMIDISWIRWISVTDPNQIPEETAIALAADFSDPTLSPEWEAALAREVLNGRTVLNAKPLHESLSGRVQMDHLSENTFGHLSPDNLYATAKQYIDIAIAAAALIFLSPALLVIGLMVRFDSPGPALFRQQRVGFRGRPFTVYKFRTMRVQANTSLGTDMTSID